MDHFVQTSNLTDDPLAFTNCLTSYIAAEDDIFEPEEYSQEEGDINDDDGQDVFRSQAMQKSGKGDRKRKREKEINQDKQTISTTRPTIKKGAAKRAKVADKEVPKQKKQMGTRSKTGSGN